MSKSSAASVSRFAAWAAQVVANPCSYSAAAVSVSAELLAAVSAGDNFAAGVATLEIDRLVRAGGVR